MNKELLHQAIDVLETMKHIGATGICRSDAYQIIESYIDGFAVTKIIRNEKGELLNGGVHWG